MRLDCIWKGMVVVPVYHDFVRQHLLEKSTGDLQSANNNKAASKPATEREIKTSCKGTSSMSAVPLFYSSVSCYLARCLAKNPSTTWHMLIWLLKTGASAHTMLLLQCFGQ